MSKPNTRRVIRRAARFAIASGGICLLLSLPAQRADAATGGQPSLLGGLTGVLGSLVSTVTGTVTGTASAAASAAVPDAGGSGATSQLSDASEEPYGCGRCGNRSCRHAQRCGPITR